MELRAKPGEILDDVSRDEQAFVIERNGQQKAFLVPISCFFPDIDSKRITNELEKLSDAEEHYRLAITESNEIQLIFRDLCTDSEIDITVKLPHGYPNKSPIVHAESIDEHCPHRWLDGTLCIFGKLDTWNPGSHDMLHVLKLCRRWITHYLVWKKTGDWPANGE